MPRHMGSGVWINEEITHNNHATCVILIDNFTLTSYSYILKLLKTVFKSMARILTIQKLSTMVINRDSRNSLIQEVMSS